MPPALDGLLFWLIAAAMTAVALAFVVPRLMWHVPPSSSRRTPSNAAVYRSNLAELERERGTGRLTDAELAHARVEMERRLLIDAADDFGDLPMRNAPRAAIVVVAIALPALAFGLYAVFGEPGALQGVPVAGLSSLDAASVDTLQRDDLVRHLERNARDGRGWILLARLDFATDRFADAAASYGKALALSPKIAADPGVWCEYADALGMAQGGSLAGRPREHVMHALALDPANPKALEMAGSAAFEQHEFASAARYWEKLLATLPEGTPPHRQLAAAIARVQRLALAAEGSVGGAR